MGPRAFSAAALFALLWTPCAFSSVWHVRADAPPAGDGKTWASAFAGIGDALHVAVAGDELWIARGVYAETVTVAANIALYGGFSGDEEARDTRDWRANETVVDAQGAARAVQCGEGALLDAIVITGASVCGITIEDATATVTRCTVRDNGADTAGTGDGGGIYVRAGVVIAEQCSFERNVRRGGSGGAVALRSGRLEARDCRFAGNRAMYWGGAIDAQYSEVSLEHCDLAGNASATGGAIYFRESTGDIRTSVFRGNVGARRGGALRLSSNSTVMCTNVTLHGNAAPSGGGIACSFGSRNTLRDCICWGNAGGAMNIDEGSTVDAAYSCLQTTPVWPGAGNVNVNPRFQGWGAADLLYVAADAAAGGDGSTALPFDSLGALFDAFSLSLCVGSPCIGSGQGGADMGAGHAHSTGAHARPVTIRLAAGTYQAGARSIAYAATFVGAGWNATFVEGSMWGLDSGRGVADLTVTAGAFGGIASFGDVVVERCEFTAMSESGPDPTTTGILAALRVAGGNVSVKDCRFSENGVTGLYAEGGVCAVERVRFERNRAIAMETAATDLAMVQTRFTENYAGMHAAGNPRTRVQDCIMRGQSSYALWLENGSNATFTQLTVVENESVPGPTVRCTNVLCRFEHATIARNLPVSSGALLAEACAPEIVSSIIWDNAVEGIAAAGGTPKVSYSCVQGAPWPGTGNIVVDPLFAGWGASTEVYVDPAAPPSGDGSAARPFASLAEVPNDYEYALAAGSPCIGAGMDGSTMGADWGIVPVAGSVRVVHVAAGTLAAPESLMGARIRIEGAGADRTFLEGPVTNLGEGSALRHLCVRGSATRGIAIVGGGTPLVEDCVVTECAGGVIAGVNARPVFRNVVIRGNDAGGGKGGGVLCETGSSVVLENCELAGNRAAAGGGLCVGAGASATLTGCRVLENEAPTGAGVSASSDSVTNMTDVLVARNGSVDARGGCGISGSAGARIECRRVRLIGNWSGADAAQGTAIYWNGAACTLTDCDVLSNEARSLYRGSLEFGGSGVFLLERVRVAHNTGGVRVAQGTSVTGRTVLVRGNLGTGVSFAGTPDSRLEDWTVVENSEFGIGNSGGKLAIAGCTIALNGTTDLYNSGTLALENSIVWNDALPEALESRVGTMNAAHCCIRGAAVVAGDGNINVDPRFAGWGDRREIFVDAGYQGPGDGTRERPFTDVPSAAAAFSYALCAGSPCIGTGTDGGSMGAMHGVGAAPPAGRDVVARCAAGTYTVGVWSLAANLSVVGADAEATVLRGTIAALRDGQRLEACTVTGGRNAGVVVRGTRDIVLRDVMLRGNRGLHGGGLWCVGASVAIDGCLFDANVSEEHGGAAFVDGVSAATFDNCRFVANYAADYGGAVRSEGPVSFARCSFSRNEARGASGGAVSGQKIEIRTCEFVENYASGNGGAVCGASPGNSSTILDSRFESNVAVAGGAIDTGANIGRCVFIGNTATEKGGACYARYGAAIDASVFLGNAVTGTTGRGGAAASTMPLTNCVVAGNSPDAFAGSSVPEGSFQIVQCVFFGNVKAVTAGDAPARTRALNSVFWGNSIADSTVICTACLTDRDPLFVRPGRFVPDRYRTLQFGAASVQVADFIDDAGDYHLLAGSPAIDAGASEQAPSLDIEGNRRPCGAGVDIGPYEACGGRGQFSRGDANADGRFNIADAIFVLQYLFTSGATPSCLDAADANDDGSLNLSDAVRMLGALFRGGTLPAPHGGCGDDATEDALPACEYPPCE